MAEAVTTRFPFINLEKAIDRAKVLFEADPKGRAMRVVDAFGQWEYSEKSSGGFQTVGALKLYGLIEDQGANEDRKVVLTAPALRYFLDEQEERKSKLLKEFALAPKLMEALWKVWGASPPADAIARSDLKLDWKLNDQSARSFLGIYKDNLTFAGLKDGEPTTSPEDEFAEEAPGPTPITEPKPLKFMRSVRPAQRFYGGEDPPHSGNVMAPGERVAFAEEASPRQYLKLIACGPFDDSMLEALEDFIERQRRRLQQQSPRAVSIEEDPSMDPTAK